jgi:hypothetical protein
MINSIETHTHTHKYIYIYIAIMHLGAFCIQNAPTLIVIDFRSVAIGLTLVAIGSRQAEIGWFSSNSFVSSCNGPDVL